RHLPRPDEDHAPVSAIRAVWGEGAPSETALYDKLKRLVEREPKKVDRIGTGSKTQPYRFRQVGILPSVRSSYMDGRIISCALSQPHPIGTRIRFVGGLGF